MTLAEPLDPFEPQKPAGPARSWLPQSPRDFTPTEPAQPGCDRCSLDGLVFPGPTTNRRACYPHSTEADVELVDALDLRAPGIGLIRAPAGGSSWGWGGYTWPYGANIDLGIRARLLDWAEPNRLHHSRKAHVCMEWLATGRQCYQRCRKDADWNPPRPLDDAGQPVERTSGWRDHVSAWTRNGEPAGIVAQPYQLDDAARAQLEFLGRRPGVRVEVSDVGSWYGHGTWFVALWRDSP